MPLEEIVVGAIIFISVLRIIRAIFLVGLLQSQVNIHTSNHYNNWP